MIKTSLLNKIKGTLLIFVIVSIIYALPVFRNLSHWGQNDWDQFIFCNAVPRITILEYHQFPLWNPYGNGGNVLLAYPLSSFLSPFYILVLIFGPLVGLKLEIILHLFLGMLGMYYLCRNLQLSKISSCSASFIFMLNSIYPLHLTEGHAEWLAMAFLPWLFLFYEKALADKKYLIGGILSFSLIYLAGSVDVLHISFTFFSFYMLFKVIQQKSIRPFEILVLIFFGTVLLCAIKILPMLEFVCRYPRFTIENDGIGLFTLLRVLLDRGQVLYVNQRAGTQYYWHEYGAYVGIVPLLLAGMGIIMQGKKKWPLFLTGIVCLFIAMGSKSPFNLWKILHLVPPYRCLFVPSRYMLGVVFCLALFSAMAINSLRHLAQIIKSKGGERFFSILFPAIAGFILLDLSIVNSPIWKKAFINPPIYLEKQKVFQQRYNTLELPGLKSSMYPVTLSNSGIIGSYEVIVVERGEVKIVSDPDYRGEVHLADNKGSISMVSFSPNKIVIDVNATQPDKVVLNQNYFSGWRVTDNGRCRKVIPYKGLISLPVNSGQHRITFYYLPFSFLLGLCISGMFILIVLIGSRRRIKNFLKSPEDDKTNL